MDITARYDSSSVDLEGTAEALLGLALQIRASVAQQSFPLRLPSTPASPYLGYARMLIIRQNAGNVSVSRDAGAITIAGSPEKLAILARNIEWLMGQDARAVNHLHIEYYQGHAYVEKESISLVVTRRRAKS
jgi:hypothetical protein